MIASKNAIDPESYYLALRQCASDLEKKSDVEKQLAQLNQRFQTKSIEETLNIAKTILFPKEDPNASVKNDQVQRDIKLISSHACREGFLIGLLTSTQKYFSETYQSWIVNRGRSQSDPLPSRKSISIEEACWEAILFLYGFAPEKALEFQLSLQKLQNSGIHHQLQRLHEEIYHEIQTHLKEILEALNFRISHIEEYFKEGCFKKPLQLKIQIKFLLRSILKETGQVSVIDLLTIKEAQLDKIIKDRRFDLLKINCKKFKEFIASVDVNRLKNEGLNDNEVTSFEEGEKLFGVLLKICIDIMLDKLRLRINFVLDDANTDIHLCKDWQPLLLKNPEVYFEAMEFAEKFCNEEEHVSKILLFDRYIQKWIRQIPSTKDLDYHDLLNFVTAMLLQAKYPEFLMQIVLLDVETIGLQPMPPNKSSVQDYAPMEFSNSMGMRFCHCLNMMEALMDICQTSCRETAEAKLIAERGKKLLEIYAEMGEDMVDLRVHKGHFDGTEDPFLTPVKSKARMLKFYEDCKRCVEQGFWIKMLNYHLMINRTYQKSNQLRPQYCLLSNEDFVRCAKAWAAAFIAERNSILKLNFHHNTLKCIKERFIQNDLKDISEINLLLVLVIASDNPVIFTDISFLDKDSLGWHLCEPPSAEDRVNGFKNLNRAIYNIQSFKSES